MGAIFKAVQRIAQNVVGLRLHLVKFFNGIAAARGRNHPQQSLA